MKAKLTTVTSFYDDVIDSDNISLEFKDEKHSYNVVEGEKEDMIFGRDLEDTDSIWHMIKLAHKLGKEGIEIEYIETEERN